MSIRKSLVLLIFPLSISLFCQAQNISKNDIRYAAVKNQPTFAACKYGAEKVLGALNYFGGDAKGGMGTCCPSCETLTVVLPGDKKKEVTICCNPETPSRHELYTWAVKQGKNGNFTFNLVHPLSVVLDYITPRQMKQDDYMETKNMTKSRVGTGAWAYFTVGAAAAQLVILVLTVVLYIRIPGRIVLETIADCDYEIEQEVKPFNPSKSAMMSENMNSDLMSMSQAAL